jgi:hypothetical protein
LGTVLGIAVLAAVFSAFGSYLTPESFVDGMTAAQYVGSAALTLAALLSLALPDGLHTPPSTDPTDTRTLATISAG